MLPVQRQRCDWHFSGLFFVSRVKYRWSKPGIPFCTIWMKKTHPASICNVPIIFVLSLHSRFTSGKVEDAVQIIQCFLSFMVSQPLWRSYSSILVNDSPSYSSWLNLSVCTERINLKRSCIEWEFECWLSFFSVSGPYRCVEKISYSW